MDAGLATKAATLRALHRRGQPLVLVNAWDAASARLVAAAGFPAVATSSAAVAESLGYSDHQQAPPQEMFAALARICRAVPLPVTADVEAGYGLSPVELVERLLDAGAVGCNLEDSDHARPGTMLEVEQQAAYLGAVREAGRKWGVELVLNARTDAFLHRLFDEAFRVEESLERGRRYLEAGADCVYPILAADEASLEALAKALPLNVLFRHPVPPMERLAALGAVRVSFGPGLFRRAMGEVKQTLEGIAKLERSSGPPEQ